MCCWKLDSLHEYLHCIRLLKPCSEFNFFKCNKFLIVFCHYILINQDTSEYWPYIKPGLATYSIVGFHIKFKFHVYLFPEKQYMKKTSKITKILWRSTMKPIMLMTCLCVLFKFTSIVPPIFTSKYVNNDMNMKETINPKPRNGTKSISRVFATEREHTSIKTLCTIKIYSGGGGLFWSWISSS